MAGDIAVSEKADIVTADHVIRQSASASPLEQQVADKSIEVKKQYKTFLTEGSAVGTVNGLAVVGANNGLSDFSGIVMPIVAEVTPAIQKGRGGEVIATGKLGEIAKEAVQNVSAVFKKISGSSKDITNMDVHIQFVGTYEGVEGDSASVSIATAVISAMENIPVDQSVAMTGSLSVRGGQVLPVGGVTAKVEAAIDAGLKKVIVPASNFGDIVLDHAHKDRIEIVPVTTIREVLENALVDCPAKTELLSKMGGPVAEGGTKAVMPNKKARAGGNVA